MDNISWVESDLSNSKLDECPGVALILVLLRKANIAKADIT
jgi:hypothetical protein